MVQTGWCIKMIKTRVYIPVSSNNSELSLGVEAGILSQTIPCEIVICATPGERNSHRKYTLLRCKGEAASRGMVRQKAIASGDEFCFMMDKDIVLNIQTIFESLLNELHADPLLGLVSVKPGHGDGVVDIGFAAWRVAAMPEFKPSDGTCMCVDVCNAVHQKGFKVGFYNNQNFIMEV